MDITVTIINFCCIGFLGGFLGHLGYSVRDWRWWVGLCPVWVMAMVNFYA